MRTSRFFALGLTVVVAAACSKAEKAPDTTAAAAATPAATPAPPPAPAALTLAQLAGKWSMTARPASGPDTTATLSTLNATADTTGWTLDLKGRKPVKIHPRVDGDSLMITSDTYESVRRKGVKVFTSGVSRLQDGKLVGTTTAHYTTKGADSVLVLHSEATKAP